MFPYDYPILFATVLQIYLELQFSNFASHFSRRLHPSGSINCGLRVLKFGSPVVYLCFRRSLLPVSKYCRAAIRFYNKLDFPNFRIKNICSG